jgi:hypothetical protein
MNALLVVDVLVITALAATAWAFVWWKARLRGVAWALTTCWVLIVVFALFMAMPPSDNKEPAHFRDQPPRSQGG